jgi:O-antigen/teichoic acid export membrane protein
MIEPYSGQKHIRRGVTWNATGLAASKSVGLASKLILAGLLVPQDFGLVGMTLILTQLVRSVVDLGLRNTLTYHRADGRGRLRYDSVFWLLLLVGVMAISAMWLVGGPLLVWFYGQPELSGISVAMILVVVFQNLQLIPEVRLMRAMRFKQIVVSEFTGTVLGCICAVSLALLGAGVWSLVSQWLVAAAGTAIVLYRYSGWRPRLRFSLPLLQGLKGYSSYVVGSRAFTYVQQNLDYLFLGKLLGAHALGIYALAFMVTETLRAHIYLVVSRVVFPVYSRLAGQREGVRPLYLGTVRYMTLTIFPLAMLLVLFAGDAVPAVLPGAWAAAVEPIRILAVASMVMASAGTPGEVLKGVGKPNLDFRINWTVTSFVAFPALWIGILWFGLPGAALAVLFHYCVSRLLFHRAIRSVIRISAIDVASAMRPACLGILLMTGCALVLDDWHWLVAAMASSIVYALAVLPTVLPHLRGHRPRSQVVVTVGQDGAGDASQAHIPAREAPSRQPERVPA